RAPGRARLPARHPLGRARADAVPGDALPQRRPALVAADDAVRIRRTARAGAAWLRADLRPRGPSGARRRRAGARVGGDAVGAGARLRPVPGALAAVRAAGAVRAFRAAAARAG